MTARLLCGLILPGSAPAAYGGLLATVPSPPPPFWGLGRQPGRGSGRLATPAPPRPPAPAQQVAVLSSHNALFFSILELMAVATT